MKKLYLCLFLLVTGFCLMACAGSKEGKATNVKTTAQATTTEKIGETYTGTAYGEDSFSDGNVSIYIGDSDFTSENEKVKLSYDVSIYNKSKTQLGFTVSDVKLYSTSGDEFTSSCSTTFGGDELTDDLEVLLYGQKSTKLHFSANFTDSNKNNETAYYNTFTLKDSSGNIYYLTVSCDNEDSFYEWKTITVYEGEEVTSDNGFKFGLTGTSTYADGSYYLASTDVLTITNTGDDTDCMFCISSMEMYSINEDDSRITSFFPEATMNDERFSDYYDAVTFASGSVFKIDLTDDYYAVSRDDVPVKVTFTLKDMSNKINYKIVLMLTSKAE